MRPSRSCLCCFFKFSLYVLSKKFSIVTLWQIYFFLKVFFSFQFLRYYGYTFSFNNPSPQENNQKTENKEERENEENKGKDEEEINKNEEDEEETLKVLVVSTGQFYYGIIVDRFLDSEETVVKPLSRFLKITPCFSGTTIQGDGKVGVVLDISGISRYMKLDAIDTSVILDEEEKLKEKEKNKLEEKSSNKHHSFIFKHGKDDLYCLSRNYIENIIRIPYSDIKTISGTLSTIHQNELLHLMTLDEVLDVGEIAPTENVYIFILVIAGQYIGLLSSEVLGIEEVNLTDNLEVFHEEGALNNVLVYDKPALVIDPFSIAKKAHPDWFKEPAKEDSNKKYFPKHLLIAEDSAFYRNQYKKICKEWDINFTIAEDGAEAYRLLNEVDKDFDMVMTDIMMPNMDGLELTKKIRQESKWNNIPIVAISTLIKDEDKKAAMDAGVDKYLVKLNVTILLQAMKDLAESNKSL